MNRSKPDEIQKFCKENKLQYVEYSAIKTGKDELNGMFTAVLKKLNPELMRGIYFPELRRFDRVAPNGKIPVGFVELEALEEE
mmetsp:Transcript_40421/g.35884  ORF Transcript_40421/g.35884 Transcript_40421/m.35884 type:complete len:83 (-) Transcript_40421:55-303(-)